MCTEKQTLIKRTMKINKCYIEIDERKTKLEVEPQNHAGPHKLECWAGHCSSSHEDHRDLER